MNLANYILNKLLLLLFILSPAILVQLGEDTLGEPRNELDLEQDDSSPESGDTFQDNLMTQYSGELKSAEKSLSFDKLFLSTLSRNKEQQENQKRDYALKRELKRLKDKQLKQERLKSEMMKSPRAKLYTGNKFTGNFVQYDAKFASYKNGCHKLPRGFSEQIKSIDTEGTCVRVFSNCICESWSQAFYPGIDGSSIDSKLGGVKCIGPCSSNELDGAEIRGSASQLTVEKPVTGVPDLIGDWWTRSGFKSVNGLSHSIVQYYLGIGNRLEGVNGYIVWKNLRTPRDSERLRRAGQNYTDGRFQLDKNKEEVGFGIPLELGGPSDKVYNVFPQDKAGAVKYRQAFVPVINKYLQDKPNAGVLLAVHFFYANSTATKPMGMWYRMHRIATENVSYGYLFN